MSQHGDEFITEETVDCAVKQIALGMTLEMRAGNPTRCHSFRVGGVEWDVVLDAGVPEGQARIRFGRQLHVVHNVGRGGEQGSENGQV